MFHHEVGSLVRVVVAGVEEDCLWPQAVLLADAHEFGDIHVGEMCLAMTGQFLRLVFGIKNTQLCEDTDMDSVEAKPSLEQVDHFLRNSF